MNAMIDTSEMLPPWECPTRLRNFGNSLVGTKVGKKRVAGWRWDGISNEIVLILAPKGYSLRAVPDGFLE